MEEMAARGHRGDGDCRVRLVSLFRHRLHVPPTTPHLGDDNPGVGHDHFWHEAADQECPLLRQVLVGKRTVVHIAKRLPPLHETYILTRKLGNLLPRAVA